MRPIAEVRGALAPVKIFEDGSVVQQPSKLVELLMKSGYEVRDHRIEINPSDLLKLATSAGTTSETSPKGSEF